MAYDPFARIDALFNTSGFNPPSQRRQPQFPVLEPEEEDSFLGSLGGGAMSLLGAIGTVLDTPGSVVRGLLAGENPLPGIFDPDQRVSGRDLLEDWGVLSENTAGLDGGDVGGFAAEVLLDPLTYMTLGASAVSKAGKVTKNAGMLPASRVGRLTGTVDNLAAQSPDALAGLTRAAEGMGTTLDDLAGQPLGGALGVGIPFTDYKTILGTGELAQKYAGGLDKLGAAVGASAPVRTLSSLFDPAVKQTTTKEIQPYARKLYEAETGIIAGERANTARDMLMREQLGLANEAGSSLLRQVGEGVAVGPFAPEIEDWANRVHGRFDELLPSSQELGIPKEALEDAAGIDYLPRFSSGDQFSAGKPFSFSPNDPTNLGRLDPLKHIEGGTESLREIIKDPIIRLAKDNTAARQLIAERYGDRFAANKMADTVGVEDKLDALIAGVGGHPVAMERINKVLAKSTPASKRKAVERLGHEFGVELPEQLVETDILARMEGLASITRGLPDDVAKVGLFNNDVLTDVERGIVGAKKSRAAADTLLDAVAEFGTLEPKVGEPMRNVTSLLKQVGLELGEGDTTKGALQAILKKKGLTVTPEAVKQMEKLQLPEHIAADLATLIKSYDGPKAAGTVVKLFDSFTNLFKAGALSWPSRITRDFTSGQAHNLITGTVELSRAPKAFENVRSLLAGKPIAEALTYPIVKDLLKERGLPATAENATNIIRELGYAHGMLGTQGELATAAKLPGATADELLRQIPGSKPTTLTQGAKRIGKKLIGTEPGTTRNPFHVRGVVKNRKLDVRDASNFGPVVAAEEAGYFSEAFNRMMPFLEQLRKGVDPARAKEVVDALQVNYSGRAYTTTERQVMMRAFPFWKFTRKIVPEVLRQITETPGGATAQLIRLQRDLRQDEGFLPERVGQGAAIPMGGADEEGNIDYLTNFGDLPFEVLNDLGTVGSGGMQQTISDLLGMTHPLLKFPIEQGTGQQLFSGRDLRDMEGVVGRMGKNFGLLDDPHRVPSILENIVSNTPGIGMALSKVNTVFDERKNPLEKAANLLTGARITTVGDRDRDQALREFIENELRGQPGINAFENLYSSNPDLLSEEQSMMMQVLATQNRRAQQRKKAGSGKL